MGVPVAIEPSGTPDHAWMVADVVASGGLVVPPEEARLLIWSTATRADELSDVLAAAPGIEAVQLPFAGVEEFAVAGLFGDGRTWACGKGVYAEPVAELALGLALAGLRGFRERFAARSWGAPWGTSLVGQRVCILGGGGIAESLLRLLAPFAVDATVVRRHPQPLAGAQRVVGPEALLEIVEGVRVAFVALALTNETDGIVDARVLEAIGADGWLVNVARGRHVVTGDLVDALGRGRLGGAALDVTEPEPLPEGHPLWTEPRCLITPHVGNTPEMRRDLLGRRVRVNVRRFADGESMVGLVDPVLGY